MKTFALTALLAAIASAQKVPPYIDPSIEIKWKPRKAYCEMKWDITNPTTLPHGMFKLY